MRKRLYKKDFADLFELAKSKGDTEYKPTKTFEDLLYSIEHDYVYMVAPKRMLNKEKFIRAAKLFSEIDMTSVEIVEADYEIVAHFQISVLMMAGESFKLFTCLLSLSDEIQYLSTGEGAVLTLTYYTHELFKKGEKVRNVI